MEERFFLFACPSCPSLVSGPLELLVDAGGELDCAFKLFEELKADGKLDLDEIAAWCGGKPQRIGGLAKLVLSDSELMADVADVWSGNLT
jgi:hypothetical protein